MSQDQINHLFNVPHAWFDPFDVRPPNTSADAIDYSQSTTNYTSSAAGPLIAETCLSGLAMPSDWIVGGWAELDDMAL